MAIFILILLCLAMSNWKQVTYVFGNKP